MVVKKKLTKKKSVKEKKEPKIKITNQYLTDVEGKIDLPDGEYKASWTGYNIIIEQEKRNVKLKSEYWTEGPNHPCFVIIKKGIGKIYSAHGNIKGSLEKKT